MNPVLSRKEGARISFRKFQELEPKEQVGLGLESRYWNSQDVAIWSNFLCDWAQDIFIMFTYVSVPSHGEDS